MSHPREAVVRKVNIRWNLDVEIVLAFDADAAGAAATTRAIERLVLRPARYAPPAEWELEAEREYYCRLLEEAEPGGFAWRDLVKIVASIDSDLVRTRAKTHGRAQAAYDLSHVIDQVRERADLLAVFGARGVYDGRRAGRRVKLRCPFHADDTPSLQVYVDDGRWHCFGCQKYGTAIDAVMLLDDLDFTHAVLALAREFGIHVAKLQPDWKPLP